MISPFCNRVYLSKQSAASKLGFGIEIIDGASCKESLISYSRVFHLLPVFPGQRGKTSYTDEIVSSVANNASQRTIMIHSIRRSQTANCARRIVLITEINDLFVEIEMARNVCRTYPSSADYLLEHQSTAPNTQIKSDKDS